MGFGRIIAKGFLQHQGFGLQQYTFITTPAFGNIGWSTCTGDDRDLLKEKTEAFRNFFPQTEPVYLSLTHAEQRPSLYNWQWRRVRWHFLTFKKRSLNSTNCTISLILLLTSLAMKKKRKLKFSVFCSLWNTTSTVLFLVPWLRVFKRRGKPWSAVCIQLPLETGRLKISDIR